MINNTTELERIFNNSTYTFSSQNITYISLSDVHDIDSLFVFYGACVNYYPHIFIPAILIGLCIGYIIIQKYKGCDKQ